MLYFAAVFAARMCRILVGYSLSLAFIAVRSSDDSIVSRIVNNYFGFFFVNIIPHEPLYLS